jgi:signal transduction histidine kinase
VLVVIIFIRFIEKKKLNTKLNEILSNLRKTQTKLVHAEKMASLGELTAGIAHEIQNPLNFVNNFSAIGNEMVMEIEEERAKDYGSRDEKLVGEILSDVKQNLEKIYHHGKRADAIVKGMLQHSRSNKGQMEQTYINAIADEYLRLSYHGLRAKDKSFNASFETNFDPNLPKVKVVAQDIGRVLLNLINNAFYAVYEKNRTGFGTLSGLDHDKDYKPTVIVSTKNLGDKIEISVNDNGLGIPEEIKNKIFQPFFTTKPSGQGTGLGLSLSYDIVKMHGGELRVESKKGEGSNFIIVLPT